MKTLRFSDLYRNITRYLKKNECKHDFTGTRTWLEKWLISSHRVDAMITKIESCGANCDCEIVSKVKPKINGGTILVVLDE
ncbi:MAG: DUF2695 domain-containing protein [Candidatus Hodarchaeales archaeon]